MHAAQKVRAGITAYPSHKGGAPPCIVALRKECVYCIDMVHLAHGMQCTAEDP
jgi:hypothetical protein